MTSHRFVLSVSIILFFLSIFTYGCGKKPFIDVTYRLPDKQTALEQKKMAFEVRDNRGDKIIFNDKAKEKFKDFTGSFTLTVMMEEDKWVFEGEFDLQTLFEKALSKRLESMEVVIIHEKSKEDLLFQVMLHKFYIKRDGRKWESHVSYEANLIKDGRIIAKETVSGTAERTGIMAGTSDAEKVISDIFTETINKLDIQKLFDQAML